MTDTRSLLPAPLVLMPNALDLGTGETVPLNLLLPAGALERASTLRHWVVENAKSARAFLKRVDALAPLATPLQQLQIEELPRPRKGAGAGTRPEPALLDRLLAPTREGEAVGLLSEAGMPAVADPGSELVAAAHRLGVPIEPWSGPSALLLTLAASGLNGQRFAFVGYLPVDADERTRQIRALEAESRRLGQTQLAIETPYRHAALWEALVNTLNPATRLCVGCGLSLPGGWVRSQRVAQWRQSGAPAWPERWPAVLAWQAD